MKRPIEDYILFGAIIFVCICMGLFIWAGMSGRIESGGQNKGKTCYPMLIGKVVIIQCKEKN